MSRPLSFVLISFLSIAILTGCTQKDGSSSPKKPNGDPGLSISQEAPIPIQTSPAIEQAGPTLLKQQKIQEDLMRSSSQCSDIKMPDEVKKYLSSGAIPAEQKKNLESNFTLSIERCKIRAAVRENTDCTTLGDLGTKCEAAKSAAKFIREYESNKATYEEYFGDPTITKPEAVFKN